MPVKIFILKGSANTYAVRELIDTPEYYLIPKDNGIDFDILPKSSYTLQIVDGNSLNVNEIKIKGE